VSPELANLVQRAQELNDDFELTAVRAWKEAGAGRKAIGHMPIYVPRELIHAAGMLPVGIVGAGERLEIIRGDAYFQSYICHIPRSTIELALSHRLDVLDGMLFPSICDVIRNLSGMWTMLFPERYVRYVDLPQNFESGTGGVYWRRELETLREDFARLSGRPIEDDALRHSVAVYNENRSTICELYRARSRQPWVYPTSEVYVLVRAANVLPPEDHTALLREYLRLAPLETDRRDRDQSRVVLVGTFCEQPPLGLLLTLERAGCWVVDDDLLLGLRWIPHPQRRDGRALPARREARRRTRRFGPAQSRRGGHLLCAQFLRSRPAGATHAGGSPRPRGHSPHAVQILRRHRPVRGHP
jgi:benzoyl-CoA reductase subunit C